MVRSSGPGALSGNTYRVPEFLVPVLAVGALGTLNRLQRRSNIRIISDRGMTAALAIVAIDLTVVALWVAWFRYHG
jgi:hypothetical protein